MRRLYSYLALLVSACALLWSACTPAAAGLVPPPTETAVLAETIQIQDTLLPIEVSTREPDVVDSLLPAITATQTEIPAGTPTATATSTEVPTPQLPLAELIDTPAIPQETIKESTEEAESGGNCYQAELVEEETSPAGGSVAAGVQLEKVWTVRNNGSCSWAAGFTLEFLNGETMDAVGAALPFVDIPPGEIVDLGLIVVAPEAPGSHIGNWMMRFNDGTLIGMGSDGQSPLRLEVNVQAASQISYEFTRDICEATWSSQMVYGLDCPTAGLPGTIGWVGIDLQPILEDGRTENEPALIMAPSEGSGGYISGFYPPVHIEQGDWFSSVIGCLQGYSGCNVVFQLNYYTLEDPTTRTLGSWGETYNQNITHIDISLSALVGQDVIFQLLVLSNGDSVDDRVFWLSPHIAR